MKHPYSFSMQTSSTQEASHLTRDTAAGEQALLEEGQSRPEEKDIPEESEIFPLEENPAKVEGETICTICTRSVR